MAILGWHSEFWRSREVVAAALKQAKAAGLRLYVQLLLSDQVAYSRARRAFRSRGYFTPLCDV